MLLLSLDLVIYFKLLLLSDLIQSYHITLIPRQMNTSVIHCSEMYKFLLRGQETQCLLLILIHNPFLIILSCPFSHFSLVDSSSQGALTALIENQDSVSRLYMVTHKLLQLQ